MSLKDHCSAEVDIALALILKEQEKSVASLMNGTWGTNPRKEYQQKALLFLELHGKGMFNPIEIYLEE
tara:strand:- start:202 stop:405 length:204 start_codon:yes stop_codon:yes gene_type:complete